MSKPVIETEGLTVYYGRHPGIIDVDLTVRQGEVFGFLGPNGAGKTTTLRVLLDVIRPTRGTAHLFDLDSQKEGSAVRQRIGYLPGELNLPPELTGRRVLKLIGEIRGLSDTTYRDQLIERLHLDPTRKVREYSRGNKQKVGLIAAFMHRPDLLILDEPTGGLDPLIQQVVLELVREARGDGRTTLFSSHVLSEVQSVCDRVGMIRAGRLIATEHVETLMEQQFHRLRLTFRQPPPASAFAQDGVKRVDHQNGEIDLEVRHNLSSVMQEAAGYGIIDIETQPVRLEDVFLTYYDERQS